MSGVLFVKFPILEIDAQGSSRYGMGSSGSDRRHGAPRRSWRWHSCASSAPRIRILRPPAIKPEIAKMLELRLVPRLPTNEACPRLQRSLVSRGDVVEKLCARGMSQWFRLHSGMLPSREISDSACKPHRFGTVTRARAKAWSQLVSCAATLWTPRFPARSPHRSPSWRTTCPAAASRASG